MFALCRALTLIVASILVAWFVGVSIFSSTSSLFAQSPSTLVSTNLRPNDSIYAAFEQRSRQNIPPDTAFFALALSLAIDLRDRDPDAAIRVARTAVSVATALQDTSALVRAFHALGYAYKNRGMFSLAVENFLQGLTIAEQRRDTAWMSANTNGLGVTYNEQRRYDDARGYLLRSLRLAESLRDTRNMQTVLNNLGYLLWRLREFDSALGFHGQALRLAVEARDTLRMGISYINFGVCYQGKRDFAKALDFLNTALRLHLQNGNKRNEMLARFYIGWTLYDMRRPADALPYALAAVDMADTLKMHAQAQNAFMILSDIYTALGKHQDATQAMTRYAGIKDSLYSAENSAQIAALETAFKSEKKDKEIQLLQQANEQKTFERTLYALGLTLVLVFAAVLLFLNREKTYANKEVLRQKNILEEQAKEIELTNTKLYESNVQLHELNTAVAQKVGELETIDRIVQIINSEVALDKLLPMLLEQGHILLPSVERSSILLRSTDSTTYHFAIFRGYNPDEFTHLCFSSEEIRERYVDSQSAMDEGVYVFRDYTYQTASGAAFTNTAPQCSLVMTILLEGDMLKNDVIQNNLPEGILFFDNYTSPEAFSALDIMRFQRFRKHVVTAFAKASIVKAEHEAVARLAAQNQRLQELDKEKNEFLGIAAHDMKSPLAGIMASIGILRRFPERLNSDEQKRLLLTIEHTAKRMSEVITNLLDINAIESGAMNLTPQSFDLADLIRELLDQHRDRAVAKIITLHFFAESGINTALADPNATAQIIDNLLSNALKYSPEGKNIFVRLKGHWSGDNSTDAPMTKSFLRLEVADEGPGISTEDKKKLFGKFARLSARPTGGEHSTGLGLSVVKKLAEAMGGQVWCESELGKGATFILVLPSSNSAWKQT